MGADLFQRPSSGADPQAEAVKAYLRMWDGIQESWSDEWKCYTAEPKISRWENCREQGYVIHMRVFGIKSRQINIAFFEHRNSDNIVAIRWEQRTINAPTIDTAEFGDVYKTKHDVSHSVSVGEAMKMADWIFVQLTDFWKAAS